MRSFNFHQPTKIVFGVGSLSNIAQYVREFGKRCLLVTTDSKGNLAETYDQVILLLKEGRIEVSHYDGVIPNPTTDCVSKGAKMAKEFHADVILGLGGGSSMDVAKAIAVEVTHSGSCWDYLFFRDSQPTKSTLPVITVTTTSGTGSQVTQVAVVTQTKTKTKSALYNANLFPRFAIVDPKLMLSVPSHITASTGFDVFCHAFESFIHTSKSPYTDLLAKEAILLTANYLPKVVKDGSWLEGREAMAWADTLAGLCIANAGVTLPHGIGMTISGHFPQIMHGESLAITYPEFTRFTVPYAIEQFASIGRIFNARLSDLTDEEAAFQACKIIDNFLKEIGMWLNFKNLGVPLDKLSAIANDSTVLPDYKNNPRVADHDEIYQMLLKSYDRE